jgi:hypothetical protein
MKNSEPCTQNQHCQKPDEPDDYDATNDFAKSIEEAYRAIRERKAAGGKGWEPPK